MGKYIAEQTIKLMIQAGSHIKGAKVNVLGITFKENVPDLRNSKVADLVAELCAYGVDVFVHDPVADAVEAQQEYGIELTAWDALPQADAIVVAVAHHVLMSRPYADFADKVKAGGCFMDVKSQFDSEVLDATGLKVWRL
jgi:UDP-N-acetyl-D-galactosamine dehydrogenase